MQPTAHSNDDAARMMAYGCGVLAIICAAFALFTPVLQLKFFAEAACIFLVFVELCCSFQVKGETKPAILALNIGSHIGLVLVFGNALIPQLVAQGQLDRAKLDIQNLTVAVQTYKIRIGAFPATLEELTPTGNTDGSMGYIERSMLTDPWGNNYEYYPDKLHPKTHAPLIRSQGPPGPEPIPLTNWPPSAVS